MTKLYIAAALGLLAFAAYGQQAGTRVCSTTTSGSISHEYCTFTPLVVQVTPPTVNVAPAQVTVQPRIEVKPPAPVPEKKVKE
jgi:hypothetical protein